MLLVLAAVYGFASLGPTSFHAEFTDRARQALADAPASSGELVTEHDLDALPVPSPATYAGRARSTSHG